MDDSASLMLFDILQVQSMFLDFLSFELDDVLELINGLKKSKNIVFSGFKDLLNDLIDLANLLVEMLGSIKKNITSKLELKYT